MTRQAFAEDQPPEWYILKVAPQQELPLSAWLARQGIAEVWYPTEVAWKASRRPDGRKIKYLKPLVPGYLFVNLNRRPIWDVLMDRTKGKMTGVFSQDGWPIVIPEAAIMQMAQVPQRLAFIRDQDAEARKLHVGDSGRFDLGGVAWQLDVKRLDAAIAYFVMPFFGGEREVQIPIEKVVKVAT